MHLDARHPAPFQHRLSLQHIAEAAQRVDPLFLRSPQYCSEPLSDLLKCELTLKVETVNPIRSFKGRGADYLVSKLLERAEVRMLACASAGNLGQALAFACRKHNIPLVIFAAKNANALKVARMVALGADVRLEGGDFDAAKQAAKIWTAENGVLMIEDGREPEISEGAGSIAVELLASGAEFDAVLIPLGSGALLAGMARWIKAHAPRTRVIGVVSSGATSMLDSWRNGIGGAIVSHHATDTIADGIAVREPIPEAVADMHGLVDEVVAVDDADIILAMRRLHFHAGLVVEPAGAVGVAAIAGHFAGERVATVLCGGNLAPSQVQAWLLDAAAV